MGCGVWLTWWDIENEPGRPPQYHSFLLQAHPQFRGLELLRKTRAWTYRVNEVYVSKFMRIQTYAKLV